MPIKKASSQSPEAPYTLVFGASGYVGSNLAPLLRDRGHRVRACARNRKVLEARDWAGIELAEADALAPATLPVALANVQVAYYLVHSMAAGRDFGRLDLEAAGNFARAAVAAGVQRIVYLGGLVPPEADSEHLLSRRETGERLRSSGVPVTELRAGIIVGPGSAAYEVVRDLVYHLPLMFTPRWVRSRSSPIALVNLLEYLVRLPMFPETAGKTYDAGGPELVSYESMMRRFATIAGRNPVILRVPVLTPRLSSYWLGLVTAVPSNIGRALVDGLRHDIPANDAPLRALIPQPLLGFDEAVRAALEAERNHAVAARWTEGTLMYRAYRPDYAYYAKKASGHAIASARPEALWRVVTRIGGANRYFFLDFLWTLREIADWLVGGPGLTRGRRDPNDVRVGDAIDYWTVLAVEPRRRLTLDFGMKAPGSGILEFEISPISPTQSRIDVTAYWHPQGVWGLVYWALMVPFHRLIFNGMSRAIARHAEASPA